MEILVKCICSFIACFALGIQFNIRFRHLIAAAIGSLVSQLVFTAAAAYDVSELKCCFIAAASVALYSEILARICKAPVNMYLIVGIVPLVPGGLIYYTMLALVMGDNATFIDRAVDAFGTAGAIAMGIFIVSSLFRIAVDFYRRHRNAYSTAIKNLGSKNDKGVKKI